MILRDNYVICNTIYISNNGNPQVADRFFKAEPLNPQACLYIR